MPLEAWRKCSEGDYKYVRKMPGILDATPEDFEAWQTVYDTYLNRYGLSAVYKRYLEAVRKKALAELEYVISRNRFALTKAEVEEAKLDRMLKNLGTGMTISQSLVHLSKYMGFKLDPREITAEYYFDILEEYGKAN